MIGLGVDLGATAVRIVEVRGKAGIFRVTRYVERPRREGEEAGAALREAIVAGRLSGKDARVGLTGRDVIVRYLHVPPVPEWQLRNLMKIEVEGIAAQPGGEVAADYNLLPVPRGLGGEDTVLLGIARSAVLEGVLEAVKGTRLRIGSFVPNAIALYAAYLHAAPEAKGWTLLANLGSENTDVALVSGTDLSFARNLAGGGRAFTEAIAQRFNVSAAKAERLKRDLGNADPSAKDRYASSQEEKVSHALQGASGQIHTLLSSVPMLAKTQAKIADARVERVLLCGGGAGLRGLPAYLSASLGVEVSLFDPFDSFELSALPGEEAAALEKARPAAAQALGLALLAADPEAYSLEVLPESLRRRREFARGGAFLVAAGALAAAFLVADFAVTASRASDAERRLATLRSQNRQREKANADTESLLAETEGLVKKGSVLEERAAGGAALVRAIALLQERLPGDLWVTKVSLEKRSDPDLKTGPEPRPVVVVDGRGREGAEGIETTFIQFTEALRSEVPVLRDKTGRARDPSRGEGSFQFTLEMNFLPAEGEGGTPTSGK